jgi:hypothetical protein
VLTTIGDHGLVGFVRRAIGADDPKATDGDPGCSGDLGGYGSLPVSGCEFQLPRANRRSCVDAVRWALAQTDNAPIWHRRCLNFVARAYGWAASGTPSATAFWAVALDKRPPVPDPPAGALVFWSTAGPDGHVALSAGGGMVVSNDIAGTGTVAAVPLTDITTRWHAAYLGWTPPLFPHGI